MIGKPPSFKSNRDPRSITVRSNLEEPLDAQLMDSAAQSERIPAFPHEKSMPIPHLIIRPVRPSDHQEIMYIERQSFQNPWSAPLIAGLAAASRRGSVLFHVAACKDRVVGYAIGEIAGPELHLTNLAVAVPFRMRRIGHSLVVNLEVLGRERGAEEVWLEVREHNRVAIAFYQGLGYLTQGRRRAYYRDPCEDALLMSKPLVLTKD